MKTPNLTPRELKALLGVLKHFRAADDDEGVGPPSRIQIGLTDSEGDYVIDTHFVYTAIAKLEAAGVVADWRPGFAQRKRGAA